MQLTLLIWCVTDKKAPNIELLINILNTKQIMKLKNKLSYALFFLLATVFLTSCDYTEKTRFELDQMDKPVILYDKKKGTFWYGVTIKDGKGKLHKFGNVSSIANYIGENYVVNDTIIK